MRNFLSKVLIFAAPIIILLIPPCIILKSTGENFSEINTVLKCEEEFLIGYTYNEENFRYLKWYTVNEKPKYDVIALGSSRVLQFRGQMFQGEFYNAGYTVSRISDFRTFLKSIPREKYPEYLIIGLDQWMFNKKWDSGTGKKVSKSYWSEAFNEIPTSSTIISVYKDLFTQEYSFDIGKNNSSVIKIGIGAYVNNSGFRNDGSVYHADQIEKLVNDDKSASDYQFEETLNLIKNGAGRFGYGDVVNPKALEELNLFLSFCKKNNIHVIGFTPPFANSVYDIMWNSGNYNYLKNLSDKLTNVFGEFDYEFYNYSSTDYCNSRDEENIDGFHGGEVTYCKILINILQCNSKLNNVAQLRKLQKDLKNKKNNYLVYD